MTNEEILSQKIILLEAKLSVQTEQYKAERKDDAESLSWLMQRVKILENGLESVIRGKYFISLDVTREQAKSVLENVGELHGNRYKFSPCPETNCPLSKREFISKV